MTHRYFPVALRTDGGGGGGVACYEGFPLGESGPIFDFDGWAENPEMPTFSLDEDGVISWTELGASNAHFGGGCCIGFPITLSWTHVEGSYGVTIAAGVPDGGQPEPIPYFIFHFPATEETPESWVINVAGISPIAVLETAPERISIISYEMGRTIVVVDTVVVYDDDPSTGFYEYKVPLQDVDFGYGIGYDISIAGFAPEGATQFGSLSEMQLVCGGS